MRKPNNTFLWMLTLALFIPLAAIADDPKPQDAKTQDPKATLQLKDLSDDELAKALKSYQDQQTKKRAEAVANTLTAGLDDNSAAAAQKMLDDRRSAAMAKAAADKAITDQTAADKAAADAQAKADEKAKAKAGMTIANDIATWEGLKKLIPDVKLVYDRAAGGKDYTAAVHLEGSIPKACSEMIGNNELVAKYDSSQKIDSLAKLDIPFRGWNFKTSDAAQDCVTQFLKDKKDKKASGYCKTDKFPSGVDCLFLRDVTRIDELKGGPKVGFYTCEGDGTDCKVEFYGDGKSESDVKRIADSSTYDSAKKRIDISSNARKTNLKLWKVKNVDQCYGNGKKMSLTDLFSDVADLKSKLKDKEDLSPYVKKGLNNEINRLKQLAESGKTVSELPAFSSEVAAFYTKYLATSRSDVPNPDLDLMRRTTLGMFKTMERRVLDDDSALKNPSAARSNAEAIISAALALSPNDINLKNELEAGIKVDVTVLSLQRKQVAFERLKQQCQANPQNCDQQRLASMYISLQKSQLQAAQYYQKLDLAKTKACATGRKQSKDPFDDEGLIVDGSDADDDEVTFTSRCDAAKDNLNRVWRRVQNSNTAVQNAAGPDPRIIQQLAQGINGGNALPNATITPGQNGYNPALAYALDPNRFPGNYSSDYLRSLAPTLQPSTALGTGNMCLTGVGSVSNCFATGNQVTVQGNQLPPALPVRQM